MAVKRFWLVILRLLHAEFITAQVESFDEMVFDIPKMPQQHQHRKDSTTGTLSQTTALIFGLISPLLSSQ